MYLQPMELNQTSRAQETGPNKRDQTQIASATWHRLEEAEATRVGLGTAGLAVAVPGQEVRNPRIQQRPGHSLETNRLGRSGSIRVRTPCDHHVSREHARGISTSKRVRATTLTSRRSDGRSLIGGCVQHQWTVTTTAQL